MSGSIGPAEAVHATPWQRVFITLACFIGLYAAWTTLEFLGAEWMPTYETTTERYKARIEANREAIKVLKDAQADFPESSLNSLLLFEKELDSIGEEYRQELAAIPSKQVEVSGSVVIASAITGVVVGGLTALLGWMVEGLGIFVLRRKRNMQMPAPKLETEMSMLPRPDRKTEQ